MSRNDNSIKNLLFGLLGLFGVLVASIAITKCNGKNEDGDLGNPSSSIVLTEHVETNSSNSSKTSTNVSSNVSSQGNVDPIPAPEEPAETKQRTFNLKNISPELIHDCFIRIFNDLPNVSTTNIEFESNSVLVSKQITLNCPVCEELQIYKANLKTNGDLDFENVSIHEHMPNVTICLAEVFSNYLNKSSAVLIGKNYQNDFGIIKKENKWYFEFLGLNLPIFKGETDIRNEALLNALGDTLIEGTLDLNGEDYKLSSDIKEDDLKNAIPLLFYKHFGNVLVEYNAIDASQVILDEAEADATANRFNETYLNPLKTINENITDLKKYNSYILGDSIDSTNYAVSQYENSYITNRKCFTMMFKTANPDFIESNDLHFNTEGILFADNGSSCEGSVELAPWFPSNYYFPFFNAWSLYPSSVIGGIGNQYFTNEIGKIALLGKLNNSSPDYWEDEYSHKTNHADYFFEWGITDAYYFILDYMVSNCYLKSAKLLYANTYNNLTKATSTIDEVVLIKDTISEDPTEDSLTTLYGIVNKDKLLKDEVIKMGFEVKINDNITTYLTTNYTTSVVINNTTYNDPNSCYFYHVMPYQETPYETRFFIEYNDRIEYSKWR